jgi:hypothetical protein
MQWNWSVVGDEMAPGAEPVVAPGVRAVMFDLPSGIYVPWVAAEKPGNGDVARFLALLPTDRRCR